ncbi:MAG TPA: tRNA (N6-threonylcarbamoyladenosine(37)-N6)-methyltransferase TrmO [Bryobacteraceae bacterium]|nr:tRNA (N6-threonylcarbamoyladenosine(37)-N6)-methyltransferase TrmO [Bryobacteraceae bacterium]
MDSDARYTMEPIGRIESTLKDRSGAPRQAHENAPPARVTISPPYLEALDGMRAGDEICILTWLHQSRRSVLKVRPRGEPANPLTGVFGTRSPDRPNPIGLHRARVLAIDPAIGFVDLDALEAIDGTPVVDIKPVLDQELDV